MSVEQAGAATRVLSRFAARQSVRDVPEATRAVFQLSLLDWMSVAVAGASEPVSLKVRAMVVEEGGAPQAQVVHGPRLPARAAALANGTISHALDYDDTHFDHIGHPSVAIVPAALAMAQRAGVSGRAFQDAAIIGTEVSIAVGRWLGRSHYQTGYHQTATAGAFGAAAAAGRILNFDPDQMEQCLGLVSTRASGMKSQFGTMGKPFNAGIAAANGVEAALLIAQGFRADPFGLEGPFGFGASHHGEADATALSGLGTAWRLPLVQHKFHACCHGLHASLEALRQIRVPAVADIAQINVSTHPRWLSVCAKSAPSSGLELKFSYAGTLAMTCLGISTSKLDSYTHDIAQDPRLVALAQRVHVIEDPSLSEMQSRVELIQVDGAAHTASYDLMTPLTLAQRTRRVLTKSAELIGQNTAINLRRQIVRFAPPTELATSLAAPARSIVG